MTPSIILHNSSTLVCLYWFERRLTVSVNVIITPFLNRYSYDSYISREMFHSLNAGFSIYVTFVNNFVDMYNLSVVVSVLCHYK